MEIFQENTGHEQSCAFISVQTKTDNYDENCELKDTVFMIISLVNKNLSSSS